LVFSSAFLLMFLAFDVKQVLVALPLDFRILMICGSLLSFLTAVVPMFFGKPFLYQTDAYVQLPLLGEVHLTTVTLF
ncbi:MnhB domain-containing protein, partial [Staphylococcus gallinarum]